MKKYILIAAAALLALAACSRTNVDDIKEEVSFQVAKYLSTRAETGSKYDEAVPFGTYAWFNNGSTVVPFMVNEQIGYTAGVWKAVDNPFYWPKSGSIDFVSYSPFAGTSNTAGTVPAVTGTSVTYTGYTVGSDDVMVADKVTCSSDTGATLDEVNDRVDSGFTGVPTLFRHTLAMLGFKIKANFVSYTDAATGKTTSWKITVNSAELSSLYTTGDCALTWESGAWRAPADSVWSNPSGATAAQEMVSAGLVLTDDYQELGAADGFVLPQKLDGAQTLSLKMTIETTLSNGLTITEDYNPVIDMSAFSTLDSWKMNQYIVYLISIKPTAVADATSPWTDDPTDVEITFDPAVADWEVVTAGVEIQL